MVLRLLLVITFMLVVFIAAMAGMIGVGYVLTLLLPFSLFEATLVVYLTVVPLAYGFLNLVFAVRNGKFNLESNPQEQERDQGVKDKLELVLSGLSQEDLPVQTVIPSADALSWTTFSRYRLANAIWHELTIDPSISHLPDTDLQAIALALAQVVTEMMRTKEDFYKTWRVTRRELRPALMQTPLPGGALEYVGTFVEVVNMALAREKQLLSLIAGHEQWPESQK